MVVAREVARADPVHELVAPVHLSHAPRKRVHRLLHVGDDRREQMRDVLVDRELQHLRVDQDEPDRARLRLVEEREDHRVQRHRLARTRGARDQQVRHPRQVRDHRVARDVLAERDGER